MRVQHTGTHGRSRIAAAIVGAVVAALAAAGSAAAVEGPVVLGGDNFPRHGSADAGSGALADGWLAMRRAVEWVAPRVGRASDSSVAALGSANSDALSDDAGSAIKRAAAAAGLSTTHHEGAAAIASFFDALRSGRVKPRVIWIAGDGSSNSLDPAEIAALNDDADAILAYMNGGGGLIAHGDESVFGTWVQKILPGIEPYCCSSFTPISVTPAGAAVFTGVPNAAMSVGPWKNAFRGNLNGLDVLVTSDTELEAPGVPRKVILGGGRQWTTPAPADLTVSTTAKSDVARGETFTYEIAVTNAGPNLASGVTLTHSLPPDIAFRGAATAGGTCAPGRGVVTCALNDIGVGRAVRIAVFGKALRNGDRIAITKVSGGAPDANAADNRDVTRTRIGLAALRVVVRTDTEIEAGSVATVRISVTNTSRRVARGVIVRSPVPGAFLIDRRPAGGRIEGGAAIWELGGLRPGRTRVVVFQLRVRPRRTSVPRLCIPGHARAANANFTSGKSCPAIVGAP